jgi:N-dimethylarginine dimethylaminohydrolase
MNERDRILMCPPDFYTVDYVINPWMDGMEGNLSLELAKQQWLDLKAGIEKVAEVATIDPQPDLPDMVFTANAGTVWGNKAIASHFMPMERRAEETHFKKWFADNGFELYDLPDDLGFEGAGDSLFDRGGPWLWVGHGFRTEIEAHDHLRRWFSDHELVSIRLTDSRFYHIDTCFCPLVAGYLLWHPPAFDYESRLEIEKRIPPRRRIVCDTADAGNFACNAVNIGKHVFVNRMSSELRGRLESLGFVVHQTPLSEFIKAGGSAKCLTLRLSEPPV